MSERDIDTVIAEMDVVLSRAAEDGDPRGYFTCVYRAVTARVRDGIAAGEFEDGRRMHDFDVRFAALYLDAVRDWEAGAPVSASWRTAFEAAQRPALVLQHVLLGMNAHINLDLGLAAARSAPDGTLPRLRDDFERINDVLSEMVDRMQSAIAIVSPWTGLVDRLGGRFDEALSTRGLQMARARAWEFAEELSRTGAHEELVEERDTSVAELGAMILRPPGTGRWLLAAARRRERADVAAVAAALRRTGAPVPDL